MKYARTRYVLLSVSLGGLGVAALPWNGRCGVLGALGLVGFASGITALLCSLRCARRVTRELRQQRAELEARAIRSEKEAAESDRRLISLVELAPDPVFICSESRLVYANQAAAVALGCERADQLLHRDLLDLVESKHRSKVAERMQNMLSSGRPAPSGEVGFVGLDKRHTTLDVFHLLASFDGKPAIILLCRDVTERNQLQGHLMLADRMASLGTLAAGVAHEVNNPLSYVSMNIEHVTGELETLTARIAEVAGERGNELLAQIGGLNKPLREAREGAQRVRDIVRDLRAFSTAGASERCWPVDLCAVLESSLRMARNEIRYRAEVVREFSPVPMVDANESRLAQVFLNLLINAAQAIPEGNVSSNEIRVATATDREGNAVIRIQDTGVGIPNEILPNVFDPFFTTKPKAGGTGLGLAIVHRIVTGYHGKITIESQIGSGTTVRLVLPAAKGLPREHVVRAPAPHDAGMLGERRLRVLLVDDEAALGASLRRCVSRYWNASFVSDGRQALELLRQDSNYDVIVCDLMMPEVTGMDIYEELARSKPELARRMLFMTGGAFTERARSFLDSMPTRILEKPFDLAQLEAAVRAVALEAEASAGETAVDSGQPPTNDGT